MNSVAMIPHLFKELSQLVKNDNNNNNDKYNSSNSKLNDNNNTNNSIVATPNDDSGIVFTDGSVIERYTDVLQSLVQILLLPEHDTSEQTMVPSKQKMMLMMIESISNKMINTYIQILDSAQRMFRSKKRSLLSSSSSTSTSTSLSTPPPSSLYNNSTNDERKKWDDLLQMTKRLGRALVEIEKKQKNISPKEEEFNTSSTNNDKNQTDDGKKGTTEPTNKPNHNRNKGCLPQSVSVYLERLKKQNKELYKNPPVLPPPMAVIIVEEDTSTMSNFVPKRNQTTMRIQFEPSTDQRKDKVLVALFEEFCPNVTPAEILQGGAFGGTYFRPIVSAVTNESYTDVQKVLETSIDLQWIDGIDRNTMVTSTVYREHINKYKVKCGGSLGMWESSGWISNIDPYGWFQWYCRFYKGRRSSDDGRQIKRWLGVAGLKGRFKSQLCNKILAVCPRGTAIHNKTISPVIRQTLFHWGLTITKDVLEEHIKTRK